MKKLILILIFIIIFSASCLAAVNISVWTGSTTDEGVQDESGVWLAHTPEADFVQIIKTSAGVIQSIGSTPPDHLGAGETLITTTEIGNDFLGTIKGNFFKEISADTGDVIYVRAFNASSISGASYFGNSETYTVTGDLWQIWNINTSSETPAFQTDIPLDFNPPGPPINFAATPEVDGGYFNGDIYLTWINTDEADLAGVIIRYTTDGTFPSSESEGVAVYNGAANSGEADSTTHQNLTHGTTYYYSAFSYDTSNNYSTSYATAFATALDTYPPYVVQDSLSGGGLFLDVHLLFSEPMDHASAEAAFSIYPSTPLQTYSWGGDTMTVDLGMLSYSTIYTCTEETTARDLAGNNLMATYTFTFETGAPPPDMPTISDFRIDGRDILNGDVISSTPLITALISVEGDPTKISSIEFFANTLQYYDGHPGTGFNTSTGTFELNITSAQKIPEGTYSLILRAYDLPPYFDVTEEARVSIRVYDDIGVVGPILNFPNPFAPARGQGTTIAYTLKSDFDVTLQIYDIAANLIWKKEIAAGDEGAHAGYNELYWNGVTGFNQFPPNGIILLQLIGGGKVQGTCKMTVLDYK